MMPPGGWLRHLATLMARCASSDLETSHLAAVTGAVLHVMGAASGELAANPERLSSTRVELPLPANQLAVSKPRPAVPPVTMCALRGCTVPHSNMG